MVCLSYLSTLVSEFQFLPYNQVLELNGVCHVREEDEVHVVYPRRSRHAACEDACVACNVCAHRYVSLGFYSYLVIY